MAIWTHVPDQQPLTAGLRLCIARCIARSSPIVLVDEATSCVDGETDALIQEARDRTSNDDGNDGNMLKDWGKKMYSESPVHQRDHFLAQTGIWKIDVLI